MDNKKSIQKFNLSSSRRFSYAKSQECVGKEWTQCLVEKFKPELLSTIEPNNNELRVRKKVYKALNKQTGHYHLVGDFNTLNDI